MAAVKNDISKNNRFIWRRGILSLPLCGDPVSRHIKFEYQQSGGLSKTMGCLSGMYLVGGAGATETVIVDGVVQGGSCEPLSLFGFGLAVGLQRNAILLVK